MNLDRELDQLLDDFGRRARTLMRGSLRLRIEKRGGMLIDHEIEQEEPMSELDRIMRGVPCRREAEAGAKRWKRR
jgi:hypothetical protein